MSTQPVKVELPASQAKKLVHKLRRGRRFFVMVRNESPIADNRVFPTLASVPISHSDAQKYIADAYGGFEARGGLVPVTYYDNVLFIG